MLKKEDKIKMDNFNDLSFERQIELLSEHTGNIDPLVLLAFAAKLGEMSEAGEKLYIAVIKNKTIEGGRENIAAISLNDTQGPFWFVFTDECKADFLPDEIKNYIDLEQIEIKKLLDLFMHLNCAEGIAFNPFSSENGIFFANRHVITLAW